MDSSYRAFWRNSLLARLECRLGSGAPAPETQIYWNPVRKEPCDMCRSLLHSFLLSLAACSLRVPISRKTRWSLRDAPSGTHICVTHTCVTNTRMRETHTSYDARLDTSCRRMNAACRTYEWVMSHIWMSHVSPCRDSSKLDMSLSGNAGGYMSGSYVWRM